MTVCGIKQADGVCVMGECPHIKMCCPVVWDKSGEPMTNEEWLNSLVLDTKAYWLANACRKAMWEDKYDNNDEKSTFCYWKKWLKEKHE